MTDTTIPVSRNVKEQIDNEKREGETYNGTLLRIIGNYESAIDERTAREIANQQISERVVPKAQQ